MQGRRVLPRHRGRDRLNPHRSTSWIKRNSERQQQAVTDGQREMLPAPEIVGNQRTRGRKKGTGNYQTILAQEKIRQLQLANDTAEGRLIPAGDVEITWAKKLGALKTSLEALPARLKQRRPELVGDDIDSVRELLSESIREALAA